MNEYSEYVTTCQNCKSNNIKYGKMIDFGLQPYASGYCYMCLDCRQYIVTQKGDSKIAIGTIADKETKRLRYECHQEFDPLWKGKPSYVKRIWYGKLANKLGVKTDKCHFGRMDKTMLKKALKCIKELKDEKED